jgi:hypothetical protein
MKSIEASGVPRSVNPYYSGSPSDHFDGQRFFNPDHETDRGLRDILRWKLKESCGAWPRSIGRAWRHEPASTCLRFRSTRPSLIG